MNNFLKKYGLVLLALLGIYGLSLGLRGHLFKPYDRGDEFSPMYNSESAVHLRYAAMAGRGERIPPVDVNAEYPDGFAVYARSEIFEELVAGGLHRLPGFDRIPIHRFVEYFSWAWSGLTVFALFAFAFLLTGSRVFSLIAALAYAVAAQALLRTVNGFFIREVFTLPLIFLHLVGVLLALKKGGWKYPVLSAALMLLIVASWQMWRFVYLAVFVFLLVKYFAGRERPGLRERIAALVGGHGLVFLLAAASVPYMRSQGGLSEIPIALTLGAAIFMILDLRVSRIPAWAAVFAGGLVSVALIAFAPGSREHNYIFVLAFLKLRYFLDKPPDPSAVPLLARILWTGPFGSPSLREALYMPLTYWLWGALSFVLVGPAFLRRRTDDNRDMFLCLLVGYAAGYLFFSRLSVFLIFFLCAGLAVVLSELRQRAPRRFGLVLLACLGCLGAETVKTWRINSLDPFLSGFFDRLGIVEPVRTFSSRKDTALDIVGYVRSSVPADAGILTHYAFSGFLLYYTGRPVFLSPMYGKQTAERIRVFTGALFGPEEDFYRLCRSNRVSYVVIQADMAMLDNRESERYMIDRLGRRGEETVQLMNYRPGLLRHFTLVHQNPFMRVYRRSDLRGPAADSTVKRKYPLYDETMPARTGKSPNDLFLAYQKADNFVFLGDRFLQAGKVNEAADLYGRALELFPYHAGALLNEGRLAFADRRPADAVRYFEAAYREDPGPDQSYGLSMTLLMQGRQREAAALLRKILDDDPCHVPALSDLCMINWMQGDAAGAERLALRLADCGRDSPEAWRVLEELFQRTGRPERLRKIVEKLSASLSGPVPAGGN